MRQFLAALRSFFHSSPPRAFSRPPFPANYPSILPHLFLGTYVNISSFLMNVETFDLASLRSFYSQRGRPQQSHPTFIHCAKRKTFTASSYSHTIWPLYCLGVREVYDLSTGTENCVFLQLPRTVYFLLFHKRTPLVFFPRKPETQLVSGLSTDTLGKRVGKRHIECIRNKMAVIMRLLAAPCLPGALIGYDSTRTAGRVWRNWRWNDLLKIVCVW